MKQFYESILILGGPRLARFVAQNLHGPDIHTIYGWRQQHTKRIPTDAGPETFQQLTEVYTEAMKKAEIKSLIPVLTAEDETAIKAEISYSQETDELLGFCGRDDDHYQCLSPIKVVVGDDQDSYKRMQYASDWLSS